MNYKLLSAIGLFWNEQNIEVLIWFTVIVNPLFWFFFSVSSPFRFFSFKNIHRIFVFRNYRVQVQLRFSSKNVHRNFGKLRNLQRLDFEMILLKDQRLASKSEVAVCATDGRSVLTDFWWPSFTWANDLLN